MTLSALRGGLTALVVGGLLCAAAPAQAQPQVARTPPLLKRSGDNGKLSYRLTIRPGVPKAGETMAIDIELSEVLATPDPRYGNRKPINDANLIAYLVAEPPEAPAPEPAANKKRGGKKNAPPPAPKPWLDARKGSRLPDAGTYGVTFTAPQAGLYGLHLRGTTQAGPIEYSTLLSFEVWPIDDGATTPALPSEDLPEPTAGNRAHGLALCKQHCKTNTGHALPAGATPAFIESGWGAAQGRQELLATMVGDGASRLTPMQRTDLVYYLHDLHLRVREFFPNAAVAMPATFTINKYGVERLEASLGRKVTNEEKSGTVFVVYKAEPTPADLQVVSFQDRVARDRLDKANRIGYLVFFRVPEESGIEEIGFGIEREPSYAIKTLIARKPSGERDQKLNQELAVFSGQGAFNDAKSLKKGPAKYRTLLMPYYLRAAELATMYFADEREFTAFDAEFGLD